MVLDGGMGVIFGVMIVVGIAYAAMLAVGFVVTTIGRAFAGLGRMVVGDTHRHGSTWSPPHEHGPDWAVPAGRPRVCRNALCQQFNLPAARYCARCGQRLA